MISVQTFNQAGAAPNGHYSSVATARGFAFSSVQLPDTLPREGDREVDIRGQISEALANADACLRAAGSSLAQCVQVTIYVTDMALWPLVDAVFGEVLGEHKPARGILGVAELHKGHRIAIAAIGAT